MEPIPTGQGPTRRPFFAVYVALWCLLAVTALGYLMLLSMRPDVIASLFGTDPQHLAHQRTDGRHSITSLVTELSQTRTAVARLEQDLSDARATLIDRDRRVATLEGRLAAVETRVGGQADAAKPESPVAARQDPSPAAGSETSSPSAKGREAPATTSSSGWETASIKPASVAATEAAPAPGRSLGLGLSTGPSLDALRLSWQLLQDRHPNDLGGLKASYVRSDQRPYSYRLVVGPVRSSDEARKICNSIKLPRSGCSILTFGGKPL